MTDAPSPTGEERNLQKLTERENLTLGFTTGVVEQLVSQPMLYWKNAHQQGLPFSLNPKLLYRGTFASVTNFSALTGLQFLSSGFFQKIIVGDANATVTWGQEVSCAFLGGAVSGPVCCAIELVMIQQQRFGGSFAGTCGRILKAQGPTGMMRGLTCSTGREALYTAGYLGCVPATQKYFTDELGLNKWVGNFVGASAGGLVCAAISQPLDTAKTCMQGDIEKSRYKGTLATLRTLHREYGSITAIYRGYWWRSVYVIFDFLALDFLSRQFAPLLFPHAFR